MEFTHVPFRSPRRSSDPGRVHDHDSRRSAVSSRASDRSVNWQDLPGDLHGPVGETYPFARLLQRLTCAKQCRYLDRRWILNYDLEFTKVPLLLAKTALRNTHCELCRVIAAAIRLEILETGDLGRLLDDHDFQCNLYGVFEHNENEAIARIELELIQDQKRREDLFLGRNRSGNYYESSKGTWVYVPESHGSMGESTSQNSKSNSDSFGDSNKRSGIAASRISDEVQQGDVNDTVTHSTEVMRLRVTVIAGATMEKVEASPV